MASKPPQNHAKPTSSNPWDVPPPEAQGSPTADDIYRSVGAALSGWEGLENQMATLFTLLCETATTAVVRAYGASVAFSGRSEMIAAAGEIYFYRHPEHKKEFEKLLREIGKLGGRRNDIAHGQCVRERRLSGDVGHFLVPSLYNSCKTGALDYLTSYRYTVEQIYEFKFAFGAYPEKVVLLKRKLMLAKASQ